MTCQDLTTVNVAVAIGSFALIAVCLWVIFFVIPAMHRTTRELQSRTAELQQRRASVCQTCFVAPCVCAQNRRHLRSIPDGP